MSVDASEQNSQSLSFIDSEENDLLRADTQDKQVILYFGFLGKISWNCECSITLLYFPGEW